MNKSNKSTRSTRSLIFSGALLLTLSLSLALPAEAQRGAARGPANVQSTARGNAARSYGAPGNEQRFVQAPAARMGVPSGNFNQFRTRQPQLPVFGHVDQGGNGRFNFGQFDGRSPVLRTDIGRSPVQSFRSGEQWRGGDPRVGRIPERGSGLDGRGRGFANGSSLSYRGNERSFRSPGYIDPAQHLRGGQGFYRSGDLNFSSRQFETRWGQGWYGRTQGEWARHRVNGRWPWTPYGFGVGIGFYNGWGFNGIDIDYGNSGYYALDGFCPTEFIYSVDQGRYWEPGDNNGWYGGLPQDYDAPITVAVREVVPVTDENGYVVGYESHIFYYNAFLDEQSGYYGYYDYNGSFHYVQ